MAEKRGYTNLDQYAKMPVLRLIKNEAGKTVSIKKFIFLGDVGSYEDGTETGEFEWDKPTIYVVTSLESFYISGDVDDFDKEMEKYISILRKLNPPE